MSWVLEFAFSMFLIFSSCQWNMMRIYGPHRLEKLLEGWETVSIIGWNENLYQKPEEDYRRAFEPAYILRPREYSIHSASGSLRDEL